MKSLILVVEDNKDILYNIKLMLEMHGYEALIAKNGEEAMNLLMKDNIVPDLIISDIMMPKMDGYDFFKEISKYPRWNLVPFIFLTAKSSTEDIRFGKGLGVDDYILKPFEANDLLAVISGKLARKRNTELINEKIGKPIGELNIDLEPSLQKRDRKSVIILHVIWDDYLGPNLREFYPEDNPLKSTLEQIGAQLFQGTVAIYGGENITKAEGMLLNIENLNRKGYIYFDSFPNDKFRSGEEQYMLAVLSPDINYFESLKIKGVLREMSAIKKKRGTLDFSHFHEEVVKVLTTSI